MLFNVPQYIDVEDKVAGPLTAKQLGWMMLMFVILVVMYMSISNKAIFYIAALPIVMIFVALAFVRPYGQTLISLVLAGIKFSLLPKVYVWKRTIQHAPTPSVSVNKKISEQEGLEKAHEERKKKALENLGNIAKIIDSRGKEADQKTGDFLRAENKTEIKR